MTIGFQTGDLPDVVPGQDSYQYSYTLSHFPYSADLGFGISFDRDLYASLESPPSLVGFDWDSRGDGALRAGGCGQDAKITLA